MKVRVRTCRVNDSRSFSDTVRRCVENNVRNAGECVPLRVFLKPYALTPTYRATNKFTVKYFLNLVLVDEEDRR